LLSLYLIWNKYIGAIRNEHWFLSALWIVTFYTHEKSRRFILGFSVFIIFWIVYDSMRIVPNYTISKPHIKELYEFEKNLFGISFNGHLLTPNEYFTQINTKFFDFPCRFFLLELDACTDSFRCYLTNSS